MTFIENRFETEELRKNLSYINQKEKSHFAQNEWHKIWKRLRIYDGWWTNQNFKDQNDEEFDARKFSFELMSENQLFFRKISKFCTREYTRPLLKIKLIEPDFVIKKDEELKALQRAAFKSRYNYDKEEDEKNNINS